MIKDEKKLFETPEIEIISFDACDVITTSQNGQNGFDVTVDDISWKI